MDVNIQQSIMNSDLKQTTSTTDMNKEKEFELEVKTKKAKCRNVFFNGIVAKSNKDWIMEMIMNKTGWNKQKVIRSSTKP